MALTANREINHFIDQELRTFPVAAAARIYKGAFVGLKPGGVVGPLVAGDRFAGVAYEEADNSAGADAAIEVRVYTEGDFQLTLTGVAAADKLREVYATDDATLSFTAGPTASFVGRILGTVATNEALVRLGEVGDLPSFNQPTHLEFFQDFIGSDGALTSEAGSKGLWSTVDTSAAGDTTPKVVDDAHAGEFQIMLDAANEAQQSVLYHGDHKVFKIGSKPLFECRAKVTTPGTGCTLVFGMAGDHAGTRDNIAQNAWFRLQAGLDLLLESDDGVNDNDDKDTTLDLVSGTYYTFKIDFASPASVKFYRDGVRLLPSQTFDMSNFSGTLQPYFGLDKSSGTGTANLTVDWVRITATRA